MHRLFRNTPGSAVFEAAALALGASLAAANALPKSKAEAKRKLLELLKSNGSEALSFDRGLMLDLPASVLLKKKCYALALEKLLARGKAASAEELYFLGMLHNDFGMGMPNNKDKARDYYLKAWQGGYAKAGSCYVLTEHDMDKPLTEAERSLLEKAYSGGDSDAKALLAIDDFGTASADVENEDEIERLRETLISDIQKILEADCECKIAKLFLAEYWLNDSYSHNRYRGFQILLSLEEHWDSEIACFAVGTLAECYRDGIYVSQDLKKAEEYFRKLLSFKTEGNLESAKEFISGKWKEVPAENIEAWHFQKLSECILKIHDVFFLHKREWMEAETGEEIMTAAEKFSIEEAYNMLEAEIADAAAFLEEHLAFENAASKIERRVRGELSRVRYALEDWKEVLMEYIPFFNERTDWKKILLDAAGDSVLAYLNPYVGIVKSVKNYLDIDSGNKERKRKFEALTSRTEKIHGRLVDVENDLCSSFVDFFAEIQENLKGDALGKERKRGSRKKKNLFCMQCGEENPTNAKFCHNCGSRLRKS